MRAIHITPLVLILSMAAIASGCGAASGTPSTARPQTSHLYIVTYSIPPGTTEAPYKEVHLETAGALGEVTWSITWGSLPPGLELTEAGRLYGHPAIEGHYEFEAQASDAQRTASHTYSVEIADLAFQIVDGLFGDVAWAGAPVYVEATGGTKQWHLEPSVNSSGGSFTWTATTMGRATWVPGSETGGSDTLRVTDTETGITRRVEFAVEPNAAPGLVAAFGSTDVWWIDTKVKRGTHEYASDLQHALGAVGLLPAAPLQANELRLATLIAGAVRIQLLRDVNQVFLREADGSAGYGGLAISLPLLAPNPFRFSAPAPRQSRRGSPTRFSVLEVADVGATSPLGRAWLDYDNDRHEYNGDYASCGNQLGVFCDAIAYYFGMWQPDLTLLADPVSMADEDVAEDILYGRPSTGARHDSIEALVVAFARALGLTAAHEIGHSIGLEHNDEPGTLMYPAGRMSDDVLAAPNAEPLTNAEIDLLRYGGLPGVGRTPVAALRADGPARTDRIIELLPRAASAYPRTRTVPQTKNGGLQEAWWDE